MAYFVYSTEVEQNPYTKVLIDFLQDFYVCLEESRLRNKQEAIILEVFCANTKEHSEVTIRNIGNLPRILHMQLEETRIENREESLWNYLDQESTGI